MLSIEGGREFLKLSFSLEWLEAMPWSGFEAVKKALAPHCIIPEMLEHCYTEENYGGMVAVFEVVRRVRS